MNNNKVKDMKSNSTIWIVNEYNIPVDVRTRQTVLSQRLEERGYKVCLICGSCDSKGQTVKFERGEHIRKVEFDGAHFYVVNTAGYNGNAQRALVALQFQKRLWKYRNEIPKPDVIVSDFAGWFGNEFLKWKRKFGTKVIYDILDLWPEDFVDMGFLKKDSPITKMLYRMEYKSYSNADGLIFSFEGGRQYIEEKGWSKNRGGKVDTQNIGYLNNGVDLESLEIQKKQFIYEDPDLDTDQFKAIYLGSVSAFNGVDKLVEAAAKLKEKDADDIMILVYGYGNQEDVLRKKAADLKLDNIIFKGKIDKRYAISVLSRADVNIFTFKNNASLKYGTSPNKLFMYFASGKPVLSMIRPGYDLVESEKCGISVDNDPDAVADALIRFANMDAETYQMFADNSTRVAKEYDYKQLVQVLIDMIEK